MSTDYQRTVEAAERLREDGYVFVPQRTMYNFSLTKMSDCCELSDAYLRELDPSPISPEALKADGWEPPTEETIYLKHGELLLAEAAAGDWFARFRQNLVCPQPKTMGHVRTLIRLANQQEGEHA